MKEKLTLIRSGWFSDFIKVEYIKDKEIFIPVDELSKDIREKPSLIFKGDESLYQFENLFFSIIAASTIRCDESDNYHDQILRSISSCLEDLTSHKCYEVKKTIADNYIHQIINREYSVISFDVNRFNIISFESRFFNSGSYDLMHIRLQHEDINPKQGGSFSKKSDSFYLAMLGYLVHRREIKLTGKATDLYKELREIGVASANTTMQAFIKVTKFSPKNNEGDEADFKEHFKYHFSRMKEHKTPDNLEEWKELLFDQLFSTWDVKNSRGELGKLDKNKFKQLISNEGDLQDRISAFLIEDNALDELFTY